MAIATTTPAINCVPVCDTLTMLNEGQFYDYLIDKLADASGVDIADITGADLTTAVDDARCELQGRTVFSAASEETKQAIVLYLVSQL